MSYLKKTIKFIPKLLSILVLFLVAFLLTLTLFSYNKNLDLTKPASFFAYLIEKENEKYHFEKLILRFDSKLGKYNFDINAFSFNFSPLALFTEKLEFDLKLQNLFSKQPLVENISLKNYDLILTVQPKINDAHELEHIDALITSYHDFIKNLHQMNISLKNGEIKIIADKSIKLLNISDLLIATSTKNLDVKFDIGGSKLSLSSQANGDIIRSKITITDLAINDFSNLVTKNKYIDLITSGSPRLSLQIESIFTEETEDTDSKISFSYINDSKNKELLISKASSFIHVSNHNSHLDIAGLDILFNDGSSANISSTIELTKENNLIKNTIKPKNLIADIKIAGQTIDNIVKYWPDSADQEVKIWIEESILQTKIKIGKGKIKLDQEFFNHSKMANDTISAFVDLESVKLSYVTDLPCIIAPEIHLAFDTKNLVATSTTAKVENGFTINFIEAKIPYNDDSVEINTSTSGVLKNYLFLIPAENLAKITNEGLDLNKINGKLDSKATIIILEKNVQKFSDLKFIITAVSSDLIAYDNIHINNLNLLIENNKDQINIKAKSNIKQTFVECEFDSNKASYLTGKLSINNQALKALGADDLLANLTTGDDIILNFVKDENFFSFNGDLTKQELAFKLLSYKKNKNIPLHLSFHVNNNQEFLQIGEIKMQGDDISVNGFIDISDQITKLYFKDAKFGKDLFTSDISLGPTESNIKISAKYLDLSKLLDKIDFSSGKKTNLNNYNIEAKIDNLILKNNVIANDFSLNLDCNSNFHCKNLNYHTIFDKKFKSNASLQKNEIEITSESAEAFFKGFGINDDLERGSLKINLMQATGQNKHLVGNLQISDFASAKTSVIVKLLLGLSSFSSPDVIFADKGVRFKSYHSNLEIMDDKIIFTNGVLRSSAVMITASGTIDLKNKNVMFKGKIAPKIYGLNKLVAAIPLLGTIASGNSENVIEASYTVSGPFGDVKTSINPLSMLSIGFFKNLFN